MVSDSDLSRFTGNSEALTVDNGDYHSLSQNEIGSGIEIYQQQSLYQPALTCVTHTPQ